MHATSPDDGGLDRGGGSITLICSLSMNLDKTQWSGEGIFTQALVDACQTLEDIIFLRVEDAPASRADVEFNFITNELYVQFRERSRAVQAKVFGLFPVTRTVTEPTMTVAGLEQAFCGIDEIGPPDYADEGLSLIHI